MSRAKVKVLPGFSRGGESYSCSFSGLKIVIVARLTIIGEIPGLKYITDNLK